MTVRLRDRQRADLLGVNRLHVFVPAIMSVGLLFWLASEVRDIVHSSGEASRDKRAEIAGHAVARAISTDPPADGPSARGLRPRPVYLVIAMTLIGGATYVLIGSVANYVRAGGYLSDIAWLLAVAAVASLVAVRYGVVALATFVRYPQPPVACTRTLTTSPLTTRPAPAETAGQRPPWWVGVGFAASAAAAALLSLAVAVSPHVIDPLDRRVTGWFDGFGLHTPSVATDVVFSTPSALILAALIGLAATRCRALAAAYVTATAFGLLASVTLRAVIERERPLTGLRDSYPSGHLIQAVIIASLIPVAIGILSRRPRLVLTAQLLLGAAAIGAAVSRVADQVHWPSDVLGGVLIGLSLSLAGRWTILSPAAHARCRHGGPSLPAPDARQLARGLIHLPTSGAAVVRVLAHVSAAGVALGLAIMTLTVGLPANTEHYVFGSAIQRPVQLALAGLISVAALVAWRWEALAAVLIAFAGTCLGIFAAIEYPPTYAFALAAVVMVPAVLLWLSWQHTRRPLALVVLATVTAVLLAGTWVGATHVYDSSFGPTHPDSSAPDLPVERVEWVWAGALGAHELTVTARLAGGHTTAQLVAEDGNGHAYPSPVAAADGHRVVRLHLDGLAADTAYRYHVVVDGVGDTARGVGSFRTPADGPMSFRVAIGSCAGTSSNGAVFDAIAAEDPLFYLMVGDAHYGNIESTSVGPFLGAYDRMLTEPGQAALYRQVPVAYVWDDHDYGPNDAGASAPGRSAVHEAYRTTVPHYPVPSGDEPINQAFTIGRVRFVMTDNRSEQTDTTMLGAEQLDWLIDELTTSSRTHELVVWVNGLPWIGAARPGADGWPGHADERRTIADAIAAAGIHNLVMVSGDAHMIAIDDGTNSDYSTNGGAGFPVFHAAALDRPGSVKGGPYSEGTFPGGGQYGMFEVEDTPGGMVVTMSGRTWDGARLVQYEFAVPSED